MSGMNGEHDNFEGQGDPLDAMLDANLRAVGAKVGTVPAPGEERIRAWRGEGAGAREGGLRLVGAEAEAEAAGGSLGAERAGTGVMRGRRSRWLAAGSALAACIAIGTVVFIQPWGNRVEASTIISSLRRGEFAGVNIRFDRVSSMGTTIDGEMRTRLKQPVSIEQLDKPGALHDESNFGAAYGKFTITADESVPGWAGSRIEAEGALSPGNGWMFIKASEQTVRALAQSEPRAAVLANMAGAGVLLNVGGINDAFFDGLNAIMCPTGQKSPAGASLDVAPGSVGFRAGMDKSPDGRSRLNLGVGARARSKGADANAPSREQLQRFATLARTVLSGKARQNELDQITGMLQNDFAQRATVKSLGGGTYLLTADLAEPGSPGGRPDATLRVSYEETGGVRWAEISNMRDATGTVRFEFVPDLAADPIDPGLLGYERLVETGKTNYLDLRMVMRLFMPQEGK